MCKRDDPQTRQQIEEVSNVSSILWSWEVRPRPTYGKRLVAIAKEFANLDEALLRARAVVKHGTAIPAIEGDDGTQLSRSEDLRPCAAGVTCQFVEPRSVH